MDMDDWPNCIVPQCPRKCCLRLNSPRCYPHTLGLNEESASALVAQTEATAEPPAA